MLKLVSFVTGNPIKLPDSFCPRKIEVKVGIDEKEASNIKKGVCLVEETIIWSTFP